MNIIETLGATKPITTEPDIRRLEVPRPGDLVLWKDWTMGRVDTVGPNGLCGPGEVHVCVEQGSAHLDAGGHVSISGGPFRLMKLEDLGPTLTFGLSEFWSWNERGPGAGRGMHYKLTRPVFVDLGEEPWSVPSAGTKLPSFGGGGTVLASASNGEGLAVMLSVAPVAAAGMFVVELLDLATGDRTRVARLNRLDRAVEQYESRAKEDGWTPSEPNR